MIRLPKSLNAWPTPAFKQTLKTEVEQLDATLLPLQQGLSQGSYACTDNISVIVFGASEDSDVIHVKTGIFYSSMTPGCSCSDDPTPDDRLTECCEVQMDIDKTTAETTLTLVPDKTDG
jgi:hypothetical protein